MVWCNYCRSETDVEIDDAKGISCCIQCGRVLEDIAFSADVTFQKDAAGESTVVGQFVNESGVARGIGRIHGGRVYAYQADSHERAQQRGRQDISHLVDQLLVRPREETIESAHRLYKLALQRGFTRGRRTNQVAAACLYLVCRQDKKPFLLIDFSDALQVNVFTLGAVFLQLAKLLRLEEHPLFSKPVDPSLYIHRFADRMNFPTSEDMKKVAATAMRLVASMKRDWIQTGRRPSGVCGAALYIASHLHGFTPTKKKVVGVVHIGEHTLAKRLNEFSTTDAGLLTIKEFEERVDLLAAREAAALEEAAADDAPENLIASCEHIGHGEAHFKHGMCRACYIEFVQETGGMYDGANPPAFSRNRAAEVKKAEELLALPAPKEGHEVGAVKDGEAALMLEGPTAKRSTRAQRAARRRQQQTEEDDDGEGDEDGGGDVDFEPPLAMNAATIKAAEEQVSAFDEAIAEAEAADGRKRRRTMTAAAAVAAVTATALQHAALNAGANAEDAAAAAGAIVPTAEPTAQLPAVADGDFTPGGEGGQDASLSDISDSEVEMYIADEEEVRCKEELWEMMNQDWVEKQEAKRAAQEATERIQAEQRAAMEAAAAAGVQYKRGRGRPLGSKTKPKPEMNLPPAETPEEATMRMLDNKRLSSKINYNVLADLFSDEGRASEDEGAAAAAAAAADAGGASGSGAGRVGPESQQGRMASPRRTGRPRSRGDAAQPTSPAKSAKKEDVGPAGAGPSRPTLSRIAGMAPRAQPRTGRLGGLNEGFGRLGAAGAGGGGAAAKVGVAKAKAKTPASAKKVKFGPGTKD